MDKKDKERVNRMIFKYGLMRSKAVALRAEASDYYKKGLLDAAERLNAEAQDQEVLANVTLEWLKEKINNS